MKNHTIKTPTAELLIAELAEGLSQMRKNTLSIMQHDGWKLLGKPDEINEDDARELVQKIEYDFGTCYRHYTDKTAFARTAKESLFSLLESEIYWENPCEYILQSTLDNFEKSKCDKTEVEIVQDKYNEGEARTFDKTRTLIFVKRIEQWKSFIL